MALSRREFLLGFSSVYAAAVSGCRGQTDWFARELVCIHVFHPGDQLPPPLQLQRTSPPFRDLSRKYFDLPLPELVLCTSRKLFLELFPYFWPFSRGDFGQLEQSIEIRYSKALLAGRSDVQEFANVMESGVRQWKQEGKSACIILTFNDFTSQLAAELAATCRRARIDELIILKDPSRAPYFCEYPALQKGFRRPPP